MHGQCMELYHWIERQILDLVLLVLQSLVLTVVECRVVYVVCIVEATNKVKTYPNIRCLRIKAAYQEENGG